MHVENCSYIFGIVLKFNSTNSASFAPFIVALMFVLASCGKEPMVMPSTAGHGVEKGLSDPHGPVGTPDEGSVRGDEPFIDLNGDGISDDGDDLSDTERKKR